MPSTVLFLISASRSPAGSLLYVSPVSVHVGLVAALTEGLLELIDNPDVVVILIRGNGPPPTAENPTARWLCSGVDLKEQARVRKETGTDGGQGVNWAKFHATMYSCPKPTIGVIEGGVIAGGTGLALACDFLITGKAARFHVSTAHSSSNPHHNLTSSGEEFTHCFRGDAYEGTRELPGRGSQLWDGCAL